MAGAKETPRQKMIGMMYLVLTALLALQVSSEIINKFKMINDSLEGAYQLAGVANNAKLDGIQKAVTDSPTRKNSALLKAAQEVRTKTAEMTAYIESVKQEMVKAANGLKEDGSYANPNAETEMESLMVGPNKNGKAYEVKEKLNKYAAELSRIVGEHQELKGIKIEPLALDAKEDRILAKDPAQRNKDFAELNFAQTPMVAGLAVLSQKQTEISRYESEILADIQNIVGAPDVVIDRIVAMTRPESKYVAAGTKYKAQMFIAASASKITPTMSYNGQTVPVNADKTGLVEFTANIAGGTKDKDGNIKKTWKGQITIPKKGGGDTTFVVEDEYFVVQPVMQVRSAAVQALYAGCANELKVDVPALGATYSPVFSGAGATFIPGSSKGDVTVMPTGLNEVTLSVSSGGNLVGSEKFKVRPAPRPEVKAFANSKEVDVKAGISAPYPPKLDLRAIADESFATMLPKDAQYRVASFNIILARGKNPVQTVPVSGNTANIAGLMQQARPGDRLIIEVNNVQRMNFRGDILPSAPAGSRIISISLN